MTSPRSCASLSYGLQKESAYPAHWAGIDNFQYFSTVWTYTDCGKIDTGELFSYVACIKKNAKVESVPLCLIFLAKLAHSVI